MRTEELIVELVRSARPVRPIPAPGRRLWRWAAAAVPLTAVCAAIIGVRPDLWTMARQPAFVAAALLTVATALAAGGAALRLSVPGAEHGAADRWTPIVSGGAWLALLAGLLAAGGSAIARLLAPPLHAACILEIVGLAIVPGWALFAMLRQAAPLRLGWCAGLATLSAVALGAAATQLLCPIDDPAHQIAGHLLPAALVAFAGAFWGRRALLWSPR